MDAHQSLPFDPSTIPSRAFHSYLKALNHLAPGLITVSAGIAKCFPILPTEENPSATIPFKSLEIYVEVALQPPPPEQGPQFVRMLRRSSVTCMLKAMWANLGNASHPLEKWPTGVEEVWKAITERHGEAISLNELAVETGLTEGYLGKQAGDTFGTGFRHLLAEERVALGAQQLLTTNRKIEDIGKDLGLSLSQFNRNFSSLAGMTPREYRKTTVVPKKVFRR